MSDSLNSLVHDTLACLKELPKEVHFGSEEEIRFFKTRPGTVVVPIVEKLPPLPLPAPKIKVEAPKEVPPALVAVKEKPVQEAVPQIVKTLQRIAPGIRLTNEVPDDAQAKKIANSWKEKVEADVVLLACDAEPGTLELLKNLAKAIAQKLGTPKIIMADRIEKEKRWDIFLEKNAFRLILASDGAQKMPELMRFSKSLKMPFITLAPHSAYQSVQLKAQLWKTLCQHLTQ